LTHSAQDPSTPTTHLIDTDGGVQAVARKLATLPRIALDTEFHAERRYYPELMLLQVASPSGEVWIADPRQCDLRPLIHAISTREVLVHAGQEDMAILHREAETAPADVIDIQIAAGLVGLGYPARLGHICEVLLHQPIDKGETLSDWSQRPLTSQQLHYAAQDVRILLTLHEVLIERLRTHGRLAWAMEASADLVRHSIHSRKIKHKWLDWDIAPSFDVETRRTLQAIFEWRDARGRDKDQPPHYMLGDGIALDIARRRPRSIDELKTNRRIPAGLIRRYGPEIISVVNENDLMDLDLIEVPSNEQRQLAHTLEIWAKIQEPVTGLAAKLIMPRPVALAVAQQGIDAISGWRTSAIGGPLNAFLSGNTSIKMGPNGLQIG